MLLLLSILSLVLPAQAMEEYQMEEYHTAPRQSHHIQALENALVSVRVPAWAANVCGAARVLSARAPCVFVRTAVYSRTRAPPSPPPPLSLVLSLISTPLFLSVRAAVPERQGRRVCPGGWAPRAVRRRFEPHGPQRPRLVLAVPRYFAHSPAKGRSRLVFQFRQLQRRTREQEGCL